MKTLFLILGLAILSSACVFDLNPPDSEICNFRPIRATETSVATQQTLFNYCGDSATTLMYNNGQSIRGILRLADQGRDLREEVLTLSYSIHSNIPLAPGKLALGNGVRMEGTLQILYEDIQLSSSFTVEQITIREVNTEQGFLNLDFTLQYETVRPSDGQVTPHELFIQANGMEIN